jgi:hypothetical protein
MKHNQAQHSKEQLQARRRKEQAWQVPPMMPSRKELTSIDTIIIERSTQGLSSHNHPRHGEQKLQ